MSRRGKSVESTMSRRGKSGAPQAGDMLFVDLADESPTLAYLIDVEAHVCRAILLKTSETIRFHINPKQALGSCVKAWWPVLEHDEVHHVRSLEVSRLQAACSGMPVPGRLLRLRPFTAPQLSEHDTRGSQFVLQVAVLDLNVHPPAQRRHVQQLRALILETVRILFSDASGSQETRSQSGDAKSSPKRRRCRHRRRKIRKSPKTRPVVTVSESDLLLPPVTPKPDEVAARLQQTLKGRPFGPPTLLVHGQSYPCFAKFSCRGCGKEWSTLNAQADFDETTPCTQRCELSSSHGCVCRLQNLAVGSSTKRPKLWKSTCHSCHGKVDVSMLQVLDYDHHAMGIGRRLSLSPDILTAYDRALTTLLSLCDNTLELGESWRPRLQTRASLPPSWTCCSGGVQVHLSYCDVSVVVQLRPHISCLSKSEEQQASRSALPQALWRGVCPAGLDNVKLLSCALHQVLYDRDATPDAQAAPAPNEIGAGAAPRPSLAHRSYPFAQRQLASAEAVLGCILGQHPDLQPRVSYYAPEGDREYEDLAGFRCWAPQGWAKFQFAENPAMSKFPIAYHGTSLAGASRILTTGIRRPSEHGQPKATSGGGDRVYLSPSIFVSSFPVYSPLIPLSHDNTRWCQLVFQVRVRPDSFTMGPNTLGASYWPDELPFDPNMERETPLEWMPKDSKSYVITGLLFRELGAHADPTKFGRLVGGVRYSGGEPEFCWTELLKAHARSHWRFDED